MGAFNILIWEFRDLGGRGELINFTTNCWQDAFIYHRSEMIRMNRVYQSIFI
ncbi:MAG: hypothetical protein ACOYLE_02855 [Bacteroidales bacterium]